MVSLRRQLDSLRPPLLAEHEAAPSAGNFRIAVKDPAPYFQSHPIFADRTDAQWFLSRAWNQIAPPVGRHQGESFIRVEEAKYVVLHRYGEGVIFDDTGSSNSPGFLNNMEALPLGMVKNGGEFEVEAETLSAMPRLRGEWLIFFNGNLQNYYHWLVEAMLSLELLTMGGRLQRKTVLPAHLPGEGGFDHLQLMRALGYDVLVTKVGAPYVWCEVVVHVEQGEVDRYPASRLRAFQARVSQLYGGGAGSDKILVMRRRLRTILNVESLLEIVQPLGFRPYFLEDLAVEEQIRVFSNASFVIAPHGAGLSNLVFAPPSCRIIELSPECEMRPFFWELSCKLGHAYGMLPCPTHDGGFNGHIIVDLEKFRTLLSMVGMQR